MSATTPVVNRWKRYGKDRLYVELPDGTKVGWWDLATDEAHPETPEDASLLLAAVEAWRAPIDTATSKPAQPTQPEPAAPSDPPPAPVAPWVDLTTNVAGAGLREQAESHRAAAPVRTVMARVLGVHTDERAWRVGAVGEEKVAAQLAKLQRKDPRWRVLHSVEVGTRGSDIDHVVIGPGGVFTLNTKRHAGAKIWVGGDTVMVDGHRQPYVRNSRHEAQRASRLLEAACGFPVTVAGVVVTVDADDVVVRSQPTGVSVVPRRQVVAWLRRHGESLAPDVVEAVFEAARRSTTWRPA